MSSDSNSDSGAESGAGSGAGAKKDEKDFRDQVLQGFWIDLKDHQERGAIIVVHPSLDLDKVGREVAFDNAKQIQEWIAAGKLTRPSPAQLEAWNEAQAKEFRFLIAQPYVLVQEAEIQ